MRRWTATFFFLVITLPLAAPARSELIHGFTDIVSTGFDFSTQHTTNDFALADVLLAGGSGGWWIASFDGILSIPESLDDVTAAPAERLLYSDQKELSTGVTYVVHTRDGLYAKFEITAWQPSVKAQIEYYVQLDGSRDLDNSVATETVTWGCVKSLYAP